MDKIALILFVMWVSSAANAGLMVSPTDDTEDVMVEEASEQGASAPSDEAAATIAEMLADPAFQEQQRRLAQQGMAQIEGLVAALKVADDHFDCTKHSERADCVKKLEDETRRQESVIEGLEEMSFTLAYTLFTSSQQAVDRQQEPLAQVSEPSVLMLFVFTLMAVFLGRFPNRNNVVGSRV